LFLSLFLSLILIGIEIQKNNGVFSAEIFTFEFTLLLATFVATAFFFWFYFHQLKWIFTHDELIHKGLLKSWKYPYDTLQEILLFSDFFPSSKPDIKNNPVSGYNLFDRKAVVIDGRYSGHQLAVHFLKSVLKNHKNKPVVYLNGEKIDL